MRPRLSAPSTSSGSCSLPGRPLSSPASANSDGTGRRLTERGLFSMQRVSGKRNWEQSLLWGVTVSDAAQRKLPGIYHASKKKLSRYLLAAYTAPLAVRPVRHHLARRAYPLPRPPAVSKSLPSGQRHLFLPPSLRGRGCFAPRSHAARFRGCPTIFLRKKQLKNRKNR